MGAAHKVAHANNLSHQDAQTEILLKSGSLGLAQLVSLKQQQ